MELGLLCTGEDEDGPQCWHGCDGDPGGLETTIWCGVMKEFNCKAASTSSSCDQRREGIHTRGLGDK